MAMTRDLKYEQNIASVQFVIWYSDHINKCVNVEVSYIITGIWTQPLKTVAGPSYVAKHAIDGNSGTRYHSDCANHNNRPVHIGWCWFQVDFKYEWNIASVQVEMTQGHVTNFVKVEVSYEISQYRKIKNKHSEKSRQSLGLVVAGLKSEKMSS